MLAAAHDHFDVVEQYDRVLEDGLVDTMGDGTVLAGASTPTRAPKFSLFAGKGGFKK